MSQTGNAASLHSIRGSILCEWGSLEEGLPMIKKGLEMATLSHDLIAIQGIRLNWIRVLILIKDFPRALRFIDEILKDSRQIDLPPWMGHAASAYRARIWLELGHADLLDQWVEKQETSPQGELSCRSEPERVVLARILIGQDKPEEADELLQRLIKNAQEGQRIASLIEMRLVRAKALYAQAKIDETLQELREALALGEAGGFIHIFTMEGKMMARLLAKILDDDRRARSRTNAPYSLKYINKILEAFDKTKYSHKVVGMDEALSQREIDVLKHIATGLTNKEIAEKLFISLNTVRTHTKNINSKLNVHTRVQAIAQAKKLGLL